MMIFLVIITINIELRNSIISREIKTNTCHCNKSDPYLPVQFALPFHVPELQVKKPDSVYP